MQWMGMDSTNLINVFPNLANFKHKTLPLIRV
jgi:hypothetical protein